jgi:hypothetical protein
LRPAFGSGPHCVAIREGNKTGELRLMSHD